MNAELLEKAHELINNEILIDRKEVVEFFKDPLKHSSDVLWFQIHEKVLHFADILVGHKIIERVEDLLYYFEKPWKYDQERKNLIKTGVIYG